jgi:hypothetical protein
MPREVGFTAGPNGAAQLLLPVAAPAEVWALAQREFPCSPLEQLPLRARLLLALEQLDRGHYLALMGATTPRPWLFGCPDIGLLAGVLFAHDYVQIAGRHRETPHVVYFTLSEPGRRKLREGQAWWSGLTTWQRLRVRLLG